MDMDMTRYNALRLAGVLARYADDDRAVAMMARALNYHAPQLQHDMRAVLPYLRLLEPEDRYDGPIED